MNEIIVALDIGMKRTGIAKAYISLKIPIPVCVTHSYKDLIIKLKELDPKFLIVGMPYRLDGTQGIQCERTKSMVGNILNDFGKIEVFYEDERFSSKFSEGSYTKDAASAAWILENFLNKNKIDANNL